MDNHEKASISIWNIKNDVTMQPQKWHLPDMRIPVEMVSQDKLVKKIVYERFFCEDYFEATLST